MDHTTYSMTINAPGWFGRRPLLTWAARALGFAKRWEASGVGLESFDKSVRALAASKGMIVTGGPVSGYTLMSLRSRDVFAVHVFAVQVNVRTGT